MGLPLSALRFLIRQHLCKPFSGQVGILGRQCVYATYDDLVRLFNEEKCPIHEIDNRTSLLTNIPSWKNTKYYKNYVSDVTFLRMLGLVNIKAVDCSDYEGAEIIWDLNRPIPVELEGKFDLIIDSGTLEHVFDVRQAIINTNRMLKVGGRVFHFTPASNYIDHGYHQLSPIFFLDYYSANGFISPRAWLCEHIRPFASFQKWRVYEHRRNVAIAPFGWLRSNHAWAVFATAQKDESSTCDIVPIQGHVAKKRDDTTPNKERSQLGRLRQVLEPILRSNSVIWRITVHFALMTFFFIKRKRLNLKYIGKI